MYARSVEEAAGRLRELRRDEWQQFAVAGLALALALTATQARPSLVMPLFIGGLVEEARGIRTLWLRWELVDRLAGDRDAYAIEDVRDYAARETTMSRRRSFANVIRCRRAEPVAARLRPVTDDLDALVRELEDDGLSLDPVAAIACARLTSDVETSPLLNPGLPSEDLLARVRQIRSGFERRRGRPAARTEQ